MPFTLDDFTRIRPYAYHLTSRSNIEVILRTRQLYTTKQILAQAGRSDLLRTHRKISLSVTLEGDLIDLRDQAPLKPGNVSVSETWTFSDVVELLNGRVFFWPGWNSGPISSGMRHFERYASDPIAILRVPTSALFAANPGNVPEFCKWNSGAPRWSRGLQPVRGPSIFVTADSANYRAREVIELTYPAPVILPTSTLVGPGPSGPWKQLYT